MTDQQKHQPDPDDIEPAHDDNADPTDTDHPAGKEHAAENTDNESPA